MSGRKIDREAWSRVVQALIDARTRGKKAPFARLVGVDPRTVDHWLKGTVDVAEESVRRVARATGTNAMTLLVEVGYYRANEVGAEPLTAEQVEEEIQFVAQHPKLSATQKKRIIEALLDLAEQDRKRRLETAKWMIRQAEAG